jgi:hypothetical protein
MNNTGYSQSKKRKLEAKEICITGSNGYCLPVIKGTLGQVIQAGTGKLTSWQTPVPIGFDQPLNTTDDVEFKSVTTTDILLTDYTINQLGDAFRIQNSDGNQIIGIEQNGLISVGLVEDSYLLPPIKGLDTQVLKTDGTGLVTWAYPYDQPLNILNDVEFNSIKIGNEWTLDIDGTALEFNPTTDLAKVRFGGGFNFLSRAVDAVGGLGIVTTKSRGTLSNPLAVDAGGGLFEFYHRGHDGTSEDIAARVDVQATENWTTTAHGSQYTIATTNITETIPTRKLLLDSAGVTINDTANTITFPQTRGTTGNVLKTNAATGQSYWEDSYDQSLNSTDFVDFARVDLIGDNGYMFIAKENPFAAAQLVRGIMDDSPFNPVSSIAYRARGTRLNPTAVLNNDLIYNEQSLVFNGTNYLTGGHRVEVNANANITDGSGGVEYIISTSDAGSNSVVQKLKLSEFGLNIGTDIAGYVLPLVRGNRDDVLTTDATGGVVWGRATGLFAATGSTTINGIGETSLIPIGVGTLTVPAGGFTVGRSFLAKFGGKTTAGNNDTLQIRVKSNGSIICDFTVTMSPIANSAWEAELDFTIRTIGAAGVASIHSNGNFTYQSTGSGGVYLGQMVDFTNSTDLDTTIDNSLNITVEQSDASQQLVTNQLILSRLFP